jgi:NitT/TauT family transport system substrate-binding protein
VRMPMDEVALERSLMRGEVVAVMDYEPQLSHILERGAVQLFSTKDVPGEVADVLMVRDDVLARRANELRSFADAWFRARDTMLAMADSASGRLAPREHVSPQQFQAMLRGVTLPDRAENVRLLSDTSAGLAHGARIFQTLMHQEGLLKGDLDPARLLDTRIVRVP